MYGIYLEFVPVNLYQSVKKNITILEKGLHMGWPQQYPIIPNIHSIRGVFGVWILAEAMQKGLHQLQTSACQRVPAQQTFEKGHLDTAREA